MNSIINLWVFYWIEVDVGRSDDWCLPFGHVVLLYR